VSAAQWGSSHGFFDISICRKAFVMNRQDLSARRGAALLICAALGGCSASTPPGGTGPAPSQGPVATEAGGPPPGDLRPARELAPLPALTRSADVPAFVDAASAAPVSRREEVRAAIAATHENGEIADRLIAEFEAAQKTDFSRALVILSLIGEQRNSAGTAFLSRFIWRPLPRGGAPVSELGLSPQAEALERLQVKAANALPYARTNEALQATLEVVSKHPLKPVRVEAASSYLWNTGNSDEARRTLSRFLRKDELMLLDRPVREPRTSAEEFNHQLAVYLERHPELRPPAPQRNDRGSIPRPNVAEEPAGPPPPPDSAMSKQETQP